MIYRISLQRCACCLALSLIAASVSAQDVAKSPVKPIVTDVELFKGNVLVGQFINAEGKAQVNEKVSFYQNGKVVKVAQTNQQGHFVVRQMPAGVYEIKSNQVAGVYRVWAPQTAPPAAKNGVLMVANQGVVRGQTQGAGASGAVAGAAAAASVTFSAVYLATEVADGAS